MRSAQCLARKENGEWCKNKAPNDTKARELLKDYTTIMLRQLKFDFVEHKPLEVDGRQHFLRLLSQSIFCGTHSKLSPGILKQWIGSMNEILVPPPPKLPLGTLIPDAQLSLSSGYKNATIEIISKTLLQGSDTSKFQCYFSEHGERCKRMINVILMRRAMAILRDLDTMPLTEIEQIDLLDELAFVTHCKESHRGERWTNQSVAWQRLLKLLPSGMDDEIGETGLQASAQLKQNKTEVSSFQIGPKQGIHRRQTDFLLVSEAASPKELVFFASLNADEINTMNCMAICSNPAGTRCHKSLYKRARAAAKRKLDRVLEALANGKVDEVELATLARLLLCTKAIHHRLQSITVATRWKTELAQSLHKQTKQNDVLSHETHCASTSFENSRPFCEVTPQATPQGKPFSPDDTPLSAATSVFSGRFSATDSPPSPNSEVKTEKLNDDDEASMSSIEKRRELQSRLGEPPKYNPRKLEERIVSSENGLENSIAVTDDISRQKLAGLRGCVIRAISDSPDSIHLRNRVIDKHFNPLKPEFAPYRPHIKDPVQVFAVILGKLKKEYKDCPGYVYIFQRASSEGFLKIGKTAGANGKRIEIWERNCKYKRKPLSIAESYETRWCKRLEALVHAELVCSRRREILCNRGEGCKKGTAHEEWFEIDQEAVASTVLRWNKWLDQHPDAYDDGRLSDDWSNRVQKLKHQPGKNWADTWHEWLDKVLSEPIAHIAYAADTAASTPRAAAADFVKDARPEAGSLIAEVSNEVVSAVQGIANGLPTPKTKGITAGKATPKSRPS